MDVEKMEEKGLLPPFIIRDENGNKCVCNTTASSSLNASPGSQYQGAGREDYIKVKDTNEMINRLGPPCPEAEDLQKVSSDYICMGTMGVEAMRIPAATEQSYLHALKQNCTEPTSRLKDSLAVESIQSRGTEDFVPYCQAGLMHFAAVELNASAAIQDELEHSEIGQEGASSSESFITVINVGSKCNQEGSTHQVFGPSGEMQARDNFANSIGSPELHVSGNPNTTNMNLEGGMPLDNALPGTGGDVTNYIDLVSQNRERHENEGRQDAEWVDLCYRGSPVLELFNVYKNEPKMYMHSTPEHDEDNKWTADHGKDGAIYDSCPLAMQNFDECSEEFDKGGGTLTKGPNVLENGEVFLEGYTEESETVQNGIPKLEKAALPEPSCQATFVVFSPTACEKGSLSPFTDPSKNATFALFAEPDDGAGGISKAGKNNHKVKEPTKRTSFRSNSEHIMVKPVTRSPLAATITKARKAEIVSFPKPNFKNVKPKVVSRSTPQSKESAVLKAAQRSPQLSTTSSSSPSSSPRQRSSSLAALRKKNDLDRGTKAETPINKTYKTYNKQLSSQGVHAATHSENTSHKVPKTTVSKQNVEQVDKARCPISTFLSVSGAAAHAQNTGGTLNDKMEIVESGVRPCTLNICLISQEERQNDCLGVPTERSAPDAANEGVGFDPVPSASSPKAEKTQLQSSPKDSPGTLRSIPDPRRTFCSRRGSESKHIHVTKISSQRAVLPLNSGAEVFSPKGRLMSLRALPGSRTSSGKLIPKSKVPIKGPGFRRTTSISSISSTQSDQSTCSNNSTSATIIIKNGELPSNSACQNGTAIKPVPRPRVYSLKNTPKGTKSKFGLVSPCVPKSTGALIPGRKTSDPKGTQRLGSWGQNGARSLFPAFNSVDKGKPKSPKNSCVQQTRSCTEVHSAETKTHELTQYKRKCEHQSGIIQQLKKCLASSNQKFEALTLVIQHLQSEREETLKQQKELTLELIQLRGDLGTASAACEKLDKDRNELHAAYEGFVQKLSQQHQSDLAELEERLKQFYTVECEKLQSICIEEAEKYKAQLQEQVDNLTITHENFKLELETSHTEKIEELKKEYEFSFSELKNARESERKSLEESFQEKQEELEKKIAELQSENDSLNEKLRLEEQKRIAKEKANLKNPQIMYLEQEMDSLKAVLEIKNEKLHQQDIKLLKTEKLEENHTALVEKWRKLQQENEELKARMDRHMEFSRQLSTEQAVLQESLEKESKVNKRLSMENEELLWKLHNGDLCSPRRLSPTTPPMPFQSPRNSGSFSSPTVSPR